MNKIAILGSGAWGTTLGKVLIEAENDVCIWGIESDVINEINEKHTQSTRLRGVRLPISLKATQNIEDVFDSCIILVAISSQHVRGALSIILPKFEEHWGKDRNNWPIFVSVMKGMEQSTSAMMGDVIKQALMLGDNKIACLAGPNLALEVASQKVVAATIASNNIDSAKKVASIFSKSSYFTTELSNDIRGVELASCLKNVYAILAGYYSAQSIGSTLTSTISTMIQKAFLEAKSLLKAVGSDPNTMDTLAGLGDLMATCYSPLSRNHTFGYNLGKGLSFDEAVRNSNGVSEGVPTTAVMLEFAKNAGIQMPIVEEVNELLIRSKNVN